MSAFSFNQENKEAVHLLVHTVHVIRAPVVAKVYTSGLKCSRLPWFLFSSGDIYF